MSQEARTRDLVSEIVDAAVAKLRSELGAELAAVSARLEAVEGSGGTTSAETRKRPARGRTAARSASSDGTTDDGDSDSSKDDA